MKVAIACDHGGYALKAEIVKHLQEQGMEVRDFGCGEGERVDYPIYGALAARAVSDGSC
ncbi:MAG: RpiB/LacA/LacB family sugar-phosphate isomerase, partial [Oscillospiraceae bacterium]|nr:RpiB/LacA/LacB family sugar-phosphate isomerase [Oscillospiraceae bacterium]